MARKRLLLLPHRFPFLRRRTRFLGLFLASFVLVQGFTGFWDMDVPIFAKTADIPIVQGLPSRGNPGVVALSSPLVQQGRELYEAGNYPEAIAILQQALAAFQSEGDVLRQAMTLSNLALAYQKLGSWKEAEQALNDSLKLLQSQEINNTTERSQILAQTLDIQGSLQLAIGQPEQALTTWQQAAATYTSLGNQIGAIGSRINQTQAMQALGLYRRALSTLEEINATLQTQPDSLTKAIGLRSLGDALQLVGNLEQSEAILRQSLEIAQRLQSRAEISAALFSLGNTIRAQNTDTTNQRSPDRAITFYQQAAELATSPTTKVQAQLNQLSLLVETQQRSEARVLASQIQLELDNLPQSRTAVYTRINLAESLLKLSGTENKDAAQQLAIAVEQARTLGDQRALAYALGNLGGLYEKTGQLSNAKDLTEESLLLAQTINASDIAYRWQWQLGRLLKAQGDRNGAIAAYTSAVNTLKDLRGDLVSINPDVQFSFRESVEPVYRELVSLLLESDGAEPNQDNLAQARVEIESLQQAELVNFFREDCLTAIPTTIDQIDQQAAVIYPIVLEDRLEVVLSLPNTPLAHYATPLPQAAVEDVFTRLRAAVSPDSLDPRGLGITEREECRSLDIEGRLCGEPSDQVENYLPLAQQVYDWLIRPAADKIAASEAKTLVFVLDGPLLNLPMAVLNDGEQFLVEKYAIALTPGLQLFDPKPLIREKLTALKAGLTEPRDIFSGLPFVREELEQIRTEVPGELLLNEEFTSEAIQNAIDSVPFPVVHLATHGQFSSNAEDTFILTWDKRLNVNEINTLLRTRENSGRNAIELLVLSACQTATGDKRAALGLAGIAIRAGARSTVATLWSVSDAATADLMVRFYRQLADTTITKAEALRRAQVELLKGDYPEPFYWAPYVLVGNWR